MRPDYMDRSGNGNAASFLGFSSVGTAWAGMSQTAWEWELKGSASTDASDACSHASKVAIVTHRKVLLKQSIIRSMSGGHPFKSLTRLGDLESLSDNDDGGIDQLLAQQAAFLQQQQRGKYDTGHELDSDDLFPESKPAATVIRTTQVPQLRSGAASSATGITAAGHRLPTQSELTPSAVKAQVSVTAEAARPEKPAKKPSLFAQRRAASAAAGSAAAQPGTANGSSTPPASLRERLPPVEKVTVAVTKSTIAERTGAVAVPVAPNPTQFPVQESGFPQAAHRSLHPSPNAPKTVGSSKPKRLADQMTQVFASATGKLQGEDRAIHEDALHYLAELDDSELQAAQEHYLSALSPEVVAMLQKRAKAKTPRRATDLATHDRLAASPQPPHPASSPEIPEPDDPSEQAKLEWTRPLPESQCAPTAATVDNPDRDPNDPLTNATALPGAFHRFDFSGNYIPPATDIPSHLGLHHHGDDPLDAGYSVPELVHLLHSRFPGQRQVAAKALGGIVDRLWANHGSEELYPVHVHNEVLECVFESDAAVHLSGLVADTNVSVAVQALEAVRSLVQSGMEAVDLDPWAGVHVVAVDPVVQFSDQDDGEDGGENEQSRPVDTYADHRRNLRANIAGGLVSLGLVPTLYAVIMRANEQTQHLATAVLAALCVQLREACNQLFELPNTSITSLLRLLFDELSSTTWPPTGPTADESIHQLTTILHLIRMLVLHDPKSLDRLPALRSGIETNLLKFLAFSPAAATETDISSTVQAAMQLVLALYSYGMPILVPEALQMLFDHHRGHPGAYAIARAVRLHLDELAILTVPLVDDAFLLVGGLTAESVKQLAACVADEHVEGEQMAWDALVQAAQLVASRRVPAPVKDARGIVKALCEVILDNLPIASEDDGDVDDKPSNTRSQFALFPCNIIETRRNPHLDHPIQLVDALLRYLADDSLDTLETLAAVRTSLLLPVLTSPDASLAWPALCAPIFLSWLKYADLETNDPLTHLAAYYALTFLRTPMDQTVAQLAAHLAANGGDAWAKPLAHLDLPVPPRDSLFIALATPTKERSFAGFPGSVLSRTWLTKLAVAHPDTCVPLLTSLVQWHAALGASPSIRWLAATDLAPLFAHPSAPYLTHPAEWTQLAVAATSAGSGWPAKLDMVAESMFDDLLYAFFNTSFFAPAFQVYLVGVLFGAGTSTPSVLRSKFLGQVLANRGVAKRLGVSATDAGGVQVEVDDELRIGYVEGNEMDRRQVVSEVEQGLVALVKQGLPKGSVWWTAVVGQLRAMTSKRAEGGWLGRAVDELGV
ncbi:hypothetical protein BCR44DRAFT_23513 [Catenaria anguillulae PL171]|uniref:RNA polymerase II-associated protein 1 C-terminal domain-containing protein n=1 Tax=Catenaria anguillulae PL171 TaxID=765915 RepID=A0A1Y2HMX5_9FUNG|nr:hypothetical protein BCR44DRAFT_23513 [Catenaria anguillulae PL171]